MARHANLKAPIIDELRLVELFDGSGDRLESGAEVDGLRLEHVDTSGSNLSGLEIRGCEIVGWNAHEADLGAARVIESTIENLNAPVFKAPRSTWKDSRISRSRLGVAELYEANLVEVIVTGCKLGWVNLRGAELRDVIFRGCNFEELDLGGAKINRVVFEDCTVGRLDLTHAKSESLDLRGLEMHSVSGAASLKGTTISNNQAIDLLHVFTDHLGIRMQS